MPPQSSLAERNVLRIDVENATMNSEAKASADRQPLLAGVFLNSLNLVGASHGRTPKHIRSLRPHRHAFADQRPRSDHFAARPRLHHFENAHRPPPAEAEIDYATVAMVTEFDCWHPDHDHVTVDAGVKILFGNADKKKPLSICR